MKLSSEAKLGIIITIAIAVTIWGLNFLKGRNILQRVDTYYAIFQNIGGLEKNCKIYINGYKVGQVGDIVFDTDGSTSLKVALGIDKQYKLPDASTAVLYDADFMGTKAIQIRLGNPDRYLEPGDTLATTIKMGIAGQLEQQLTPVKEKAEHLILTVKVRTCSNLPYGRWKTASTASRTCLRKMAS
jgi:phospholipid/cholesterol/gamma-HCH transport system substrate-binding protein